VRILAIDPAIRNTGYAVLEGDQHKQIVIDYGVISIPNNISQSGALASVKTGITNLIKQYEPDEVAVEAIIFVQSVRTAISMGAARAASMIAAAEQGLAIYEYAPKKVKKAVVGNGNADKSQVAYMIRALLGLKETPAHDAADALAIGIAHLSSSDPIKAVLLERKRI
jgi:crossover junction endodeoxyribonuclease RuvC